QPFLLPPSSLPVPLFLPPLSSSLPVQPSPAQPAPQHLSPLALSSPFPSHLHRPKYLTLYPSPSYPSFLSFLSQVYQRERQQRPWRLSLSSFSPLSLQLRHQQVLSQASLPLLSPLLFSPLQPQLQLQLSSPSPPPRPSRNLRRRRTRHYR
ncbi:hypothetical protein AGABI1DRAFT_114474, partial [Agaricus bisporus var. burnettii JB137-S8]